LANFAATATNSRIAIETSATTSVADEPAPRSANTPVGNHRWFNKSSRTGAQNFTMSGKNRLESRHLELKYQELLRAPGNHSGIKGGFFGKDTKFSKMQW
jgi:hypothetical protein